MTKDKDKTITVQDVMVPLGDYATVSENATLGEAARALREAQENFNKNHYAHRAVLVLDAVGNVVGKLSQRDFLQALDPRYKNIIESGHTKNYGFSAGFLRGMRDQQGLLKRPLKDITVEAAAKPVKDFMYKPGDKEFIEAGADLEVAIHALIVGHHQSLLVTQSQTSKRIVGVLRLTDVYDCVDQFVQKFF